MLRPIPILFTGTLGLLVLARPVSLVAQDLGGPEGGAKAEDQDELDEELLGPSDKRIAELAHLTKAGDIQSRAEAIWRLVQLGDARCAPPLGELIEDPETGVRPFVAMGLGWLGKNAKGQARRLLPFLSDPSTFTQTATVWALGRMGDSTTKPQVEPFTKSDNELLRFLATEALARLGGKELLPASPLHRSLKESTVLIVTGDGAAPEYVFEGPLTQSLVKFHTVGLAPFNPTMSKLGGMSQGQQAHFSKLLKFQEGGPQVDVVILAPLYAHEFPLFLRWELWNYVRRGGKLVTMDTPFRLFLGLQMTTNHSKTKLKFGWSQSLFDSLLPELIGPSDDPFLDGVTPKHRTFRYGFRSHGRGAVLVMGGPGGKPERIAELGNRGHQSWRHLVFAALVGPDRANDPIFWYQMLKWMVEGREAFAASVALAETPRLSAGADTQVSLLVRNYLLDDPELKVDLDLLARDGRSVSRASAKLTLAKEARKRVSISLPVPLSAWEEDYQLAIALLNRTGNALRSISSDVKVSPALSLKLTAPGEFHEAGGVLPLSCIVKRLSTAAQNPVTVTASIADQHLRPLVRRQQVTNLQGPASRELKFELRPQALPAGMYQWMVEAHFDGVLVQRGALPLIRMEPWRLRKELVVSPFGFGPLQPEAEIKALESIGLTTYGLPPSFRKWTYLVYSPTFLPRGSWPAGILEGPEGDEWRELGTESRNHPFFTFVDTVEESDLQIGSNLLSYGDVEEAGHEQYRIYLKRKYRALAALNEAWKSDYVNWDEIVLMGGAIGQGGEVLYTGGVGMTTGQLVLVPQEIDPSKGITSLQPYLDQNAWRWYYLWHLLEIRHKAFHQTDPFHALAPGGAMGLHAPFDFPHFRTYAWNRLSDFSRRATFSRPAYGTKPHILLIGVPGDRAGLSKLCWQGIAGGARFLMPYAPGDRYGVSLLNGDYTPNQIGQAFGDIVRRIKSKQEVLLATHNVVHREALFLSEGDSGYSSALSSELYEALLHSGIQVDYGRDLNERKLVFTGAKHLSDQTVTALRAFVEGGGTLVVLPNASDGLLNRFGVQRKAQPLPEDFRKPVEIVGGALLPGLNGGSFLSIHRAELGAGDGNWSVLAKYADDGSPAVLAARVGKGHVYLMNFIRKSGSLAEEYGPGKARQESETYRKFISSIAAAAGVESTFRAIDADGSAIPYVEAQLVETEDASQKYLIVYSDHRLPEGVSSAKGRILVKWPGLSAVHDVYRERNLPLTDGSFEFELKPGDGTVFSLLTEKLGSVEISPEVRSFGPGAPLRLRASVQRAGGELSECEHAFDLRVHGPSGEELPALHQRASVKGTRLLRLFPSWADPEGEWRIVAHDLTSGLRDETTVRMVENGRAPPLSPSGEFRELEPDVHLSIRPLPELKGLVNFLNLSATVRSTAKRGPALNVRLHIPEKCILAGPKEWVVDFGGTPAAREVTWKLCISREDAIGFYYSDKSSGFLTDPYRPEVYRYRGKAVPTIELEATDGTALTYRCDESAISPPTPRYSCRVPIDLNPFELAPASLGHLSSESVVVAIQNSRPDAVTGVVLITPHSDWTEVPKQQRFRAEPDQISALKWTPALQKDVGIEPGVYEVPVSVHLEDKTIETGKLRVEHVQQREWLVRPGDSAAAMQGRLPFDPVGEFRGPEWTRIVTESRVTVSQLLPKVGSRAYAATYVHSPTDREVNVKLSPPGASVRVWLNGVIVHATEAKPKAEKPAETTPDDADGDNEDAFLREAGIELQKGKNHLVIEFLRTAKRCRDAPLFLQDKEGKKLRDVVFAVR